MAEYRALPRLLLEDFRAWRRGEKRIAPRFDVNGRVVRGRVYAQRNPGRVGPPTRASKARLKATMSLRVYRAATGQWEEPIQVGSSDVRLEER